MPRSSRLTRRTSPCVSGVVWQPGAGSEGIRGRSDAAPRPGRHPHLRRAGVRSRVCHGDRGILVSGAIYLIGPSRQPHSLRDQDIWPTKRHVPPRRVGGPVGGCGHHCGLAETPLPGRRFRTGCVDTAVRSFARCRLRANAHGTLIPSPSPFLKRALARWQCQFPATNGLRSPTR